MAYESLALISTALHRLDCGQLGICRYVSSKLPPTLPSPLDHYLLRFGEDTEVLVPLDQPFSASQGAHLLHHLTFTQTKTNFVNVREESVWLERLSTTDEEGIGSSFDDSCVWVYYSVIS